MAVSARRLGPARHACLWAILSLAMAIGVCGRAPSALPSVERGDFPPNGRAAERAGTARQPSSATNALRAGPKLRFDARPTEPSGAPPANLRPVPGTPPAGPSAEQPALPMISGPRDLLRRHGVDDSYFEGLADGRPVSDSETATLLKVMFWMRDFRLLDLGRWARGKLNLTQLVADPEADRGQLFLLSGRVGRVELRRPSPEAAQRLQLQEYYRCEFILDGGQQPAVIFAAKVPSQWQENKPIDERAKTFGLFLKLAGKDRRRPMPVFVARHVAWYPPTLLGSLGMDVALLDDVVDRTGLGRSRRVDEHEVLRAGREREAFYAMLDAVGRAKPGQLLREADTQLKQADEKLQRTDDQGNPQFSVVPLFMDAAKQRGRLVALSGRARRVVRIRVEDQDIVARFRLDHYYEISFFTDDSEGNPLVCCVRELPQGMPTGDSPDYSENIRVAGFFFKLWSYPTPKPEDAPEIPRGGGVFRQPAPLLIGLQAVWYPQRPRATSPIAGVIAGGLFLLALLGVWLALWQSGRSDKRFHDQTIAKTLSIERGVSLDEIGRSAESAVASAADEGPDQDRTGPDDA
jgi:hypothetical protein